MGDYKPSYKTSEFWFTLVSFIISGLFLFGIITDHDTKEELIGVITHAVESCILIGGQLTILYRYIDSRKKQKIEHEKTKRKRHDQIDKELENYIGVDKKHDLININTATIGDLVQLPHIGPATAAKIIEYRESNGDFEDKKDIMRVPGIAESTYKEIKNHIVI